MYISELALNWNFQRNPYEIHRLLWGFFPGMPESKRPFLYRVSSRRTEEPFGILMQSSIAPDDKAKVKGCVLSRTKEFHLSLAKGQMYRFLLCANPIKRLAKERCRVPLIDEDQLYSWLAKKLATGANLEAAQITSKQNLYFKKAGKAGKVVIVTFSGLLKVRDAKEMLELLGNGIGAAKSFGCGLLSLARS